MEAPHPGICSLLDKCKHNLQRCFDRSECSDTCDSHPGTHQYLKNRRYPILSCSVYQFFLYLINGKYFNVVSKCRFNPLCFIV